MENLGGEEIERALMDLGPLLGVSIKEELPEEAGAPAQPTTAGVAAADGGPAAAEGKEEDAAAAACVICACALASAPGVPRLMDCLHSLCEPCLTAKLEEKQASGRDFLGAERATVTCPRCRLQCAAGAMVEQRFVMERRAADSGAALGVHAGSQQCNSCEEAAAATSYCGDCAEFICDSCVRAHQRLKITKDHTIKSKEEALSELAAQAGARAAHDMYCRDHPQERLSLFCETCDRLTCRDCQLQHHRDHKYQFSTEMAAQARASIAALVSEVSYKRVLLGSAMQVIHDRQMLIADKKKALVHEITQTVVKLTNAINSRGKQLVLRLNEVCDGKQRTLSEKKAALEQLAAITDHCVGFVGAALARGSDTALLHTKRAVTAHLQRIKARRADIPNPEIPVRIALAIDNLPELVRVLSTVGAIVVDGKVDGAGGGAGGGGGSAPGGGAGGSAGGAAGGGFQHGSPGVHNAIMPMHPAAMHQSYVQSMSNAVSGAYAAAASAANALRGRAPHTPLRHPHVTSTTHPHHLHGMSELNLRGLLSPSGPRALPPAPPQPPARLLNAHNSHNAHNAAMHAYQQMMGAYAGGAFVNSGRRSGGPRTPSPAPVYPAPPPHHPPPPQQQQQQQQPQLAKWHIPQHSAPNGAIASSVEGVGAEFKITLSRPQSAPRPPLVSSTNPKTPSPSLNGSGAGMELDKLCAESVQDLMATIAKLDSNGVQVVAEGGGGGGPSPAPHVTSTEDKPPAATDPNEDWCAVCMDGGELICCDKCPKVFHQYCHIPTIDKLPEETETWQCLLCVNFAELPPEEGSGGSGAVTPRLQKIMERITLELYCQYELSVCVREPPPAPPGAPPQPCLDTVRLRLQPAAPHRYITVEEFIADCRLLFHNACTYNAPESQPHKDAKRLEEFFDAQLAKWLPEQAAWAGQPPHKRARTH